MNRMALKAQEKAATVNITRVSCSNNDEDKKETSLSDYESDQRRAGKKDEGQSAIILVHPVHLFSLGQLPAEKLL